jgi:hypothetical protein
MFGFYKSDQTMLVLYFNERAVQFPFDKSKTDLLSEFRKLGWVPLKTRLNDFLKINPYNQEALGTLFSSAVGDLQQLVSSNRQQPMQNDNIAMQSFIEVLNMIYDADSMDWMTNISILSSFARLASYNNTPILQENLELQKILNNILELLEKEIIRYPYSALRYSNWAGLATIAKIPDPRRLLSKLNFPPSNVKMYDFVSRLAEPLFSNSKMNENFKYQIDEESKAFLVDDAFSFLDYGVEWMERQDPYLDGVFSEAHLRFATNYIGYLIEFRRFPELIKYLNNVRIKVGVDWPKLVNELKKPAIFHFRDIKNIPRSSKKKVDEIMALPTAVGEANKRISGISASHNFSKESYDKLFAALTRRKVHSILTKDANLPKNSWTLRNKNALIASGSIIPNDNNINDNSEILELVELMRKEEFKNLATIEQFIRMNPDCHDAMNLYCTEAAKYLPDLELENKIFNYSSITRTPPPFDAYSKMTNKDNWSRLASDAIGEGLLRLCDAPSSIERNPWLNLSRWEDMDLHKNAIDWYAFLKNANFWHAPVYYVQHTVMPEVVFVKFLSQAEKATDWITILSACRVRYEWDQKKCQNEKILATWKRAEGM